MTHPKDLPRAAPIPLITVYAVPHNEQRYPTVGDWRFDAEGHLSIYVSKEIGNPYYISLVALHEIAEALLCRKRRIREEDVTRFDQLFEREREAGKHSEGAEPGEDPRAPYWREHQIATAIEKQMAYWLGVSWAEYDKAAGAL